MNISIFDVIYERYKIKKPLRLIELFAGIGSQSKALKRLGVDFKHYRVVEFDKYAIDSYNAIHETNFQTSDITKIGAKDLAIVETDKYDYIMTYSFPCQDLSLAGKQKGMAKGDKTRSGLLWEVERILEECCGYKEHRVSPRNSKYLSMADWVDDYNFDIDKNKLPQILLMENVPQVAGANNVKDFNKWQNKLEQLGYKNYTNMLNAKDYNIPQNRKRCFMISVLGDYYYEFPRKQKLKLRLKDMLEDEVDEKYYLSKKQIAQIESWNAQQKPLEVAKSKDDEYIQTITAKSNTSMNASMLLIKEATKQGYAEAHDGDGVYIDRPHQKRGVVQKGMIQTIKAQCGDIGVVVKNNIKNINDENGTFSTLGTNCGSSTSAGGGVVVVKGGAIRNRPNVKGANSPNLELRKDDVSNTLTTFDKDNVIVVGEHRRDEGIRTFKGDVIGTLRAKEAGGDKVVLVKGNYSKSNHSASRIVDINGIAPTVMENHGTVTAIELKNDEIKMPKVIGGVGEKKSNGGTQFYQQDRVYSGDGIALAHLASLPRGSYNYQIDSLSIRKLTPKECFRLMGFDDEDFNKASKVNSSSQLYKQAGNSIVVNVLEAIFKELF